jgi:hypothetical protein
MFKAGSRFDSSAQKLFEVRQKSEIHYGAVWLGMETQH